MAVQTSTAASVSDSLMTVTPGASGGGPQAATASGSLCQCRRRGPATGAWAPSLCSNVEGIDSDLLTDVQCLVGAMAKCDLRVCSLVFVLQANNAIVPTRVCGCLPQQRGDGTEQQHTVNESETRTRTFARCQDAHVTKLNLMEHKRAKEHLWKRP